MPFLVLLLLIVPLAELWVILQVGSLIGTGPTIALLLVDSLLGAFLLRQQGRSTWARFRGALRSARVPATETADGALVILGGALLLTPGFITDAVGLLLLIPGSRAVARRLALRRAMVAGAASIGGPAVWTVRGADWTRRGAQAYRARGGSSPRARRAYDVEGTAVDTDRPGLRPESQPGT
jgi:UPF0716 protein FxsA